MSGSLDTKGSSHPWHTNTTRSLRHECPLGAGLTEALTQGPHQSGSTMNSSTEGSCAHESVACVFLGEAGGSKQPGWPHAQAQRPEPGICECTGTSRSQETAITEKPSLLTVHLEARFHPPGLHWRMTILESWPEFQASVNLPRHPHKWDNFAHRHMGARWEQHRLSIPLGSCSGWLLLRANCGLTSLILF